MGLESFLDFGNLFIDKMPLGRASGVGAMGPNEQVQTQPSRASGAVELWPFLWSMEGPEGPRDIPEGSQGRARGSQGRPPGVPGACLGYQGRPRGVQGGAQGIPGIPGDSRDVPGIPKIFFIKM